jgi:hypothetical protein
MSLVNPAARSARASEHAEALAQLEGVRLEGERLFNLEVRVDAQAILLDGDDDAVDVLGRDDIAPGKDQRVLWQVLTAPDARRLAHRTE